jgi:predicted membrane protein
MNNKLLIFGLILIALGMILWLNSMSILHLSGDDFAGILAPMALIGVGIWLMVRKHRRKIPAQNPPQPQNAFTAPPAPENPGSAFETPTQDPRFASWGATAANHDPKVSAQPGFSNLGRVKYDKFIGDMYIDCVGIDMQNVEVAVFVGDIEIKLHGATLAPGLNRMIISGFIGDVRILVPPDMAVFAQSSNFIGDANLMGRHSSGVGSTIDAQTLNYKSAESKLYIASNFFIGDIRVYVV